VPLLHEAIAPRGAASTRAVVDHPIEEITPAARTSVMVLTTVITIARTISIAIGETVVTATATIVKLTTA
jgi:hypothetical protein